MVELGLVLSNKEYVLDVPDGLVACQLAHAIVRSAGWDVLAENWKLALFHEENYIMLPHTFPIKQLEHKWVTIAVSLEPEVWN